ncbi:MAG TPA: hypothetical protein VI112_06745, partial [Bacteroidia bacterium]
MKKIIGSIFTAALGGAMALGLNHYFVKPENNSIAGKQQPNNAHYVSMPSGMPETAVNFVQAADMTVHAVVHIKTTYASEPVSSNNSYDPFRDFFW